MSSVGARIDEPPTEVAETPKETPTPITSSEPNPKLLPETCDEKRPHTRNRDPKNPAARTPRPPAGAPKPDETVAKAETGRNQLPKARRRNPHSSSAPGQKKQRLTRCEAAGSSGNRRQRTALSN